MASTEADDTGHVIDCFCAGGLVLALRIDNLDLIRSAYGEAAAFAARDAVASLLDRHFPGAQIQPSSGAVIAASIPAASWAQLPSLSSVIDGFCQLVMARPVEFDGERFLLSVTIGYDLVSDTDSAGDIAALSAAQVMLCATKSPAEHPVTIEADWTEQYRSDMEAAVALLDRVDRGETHFVWQPICNAIAQEAALYYEALLRMVSTDGQQLTCGASIGAMERIGLARVLDQRAMSIILDELEADPLVCLGLNISGQSASFHLNGYNSSWSNLRDRLSRDRSLARRLVIEITETAPPPSLLEAVEFVSELRALGCRVAIDDFGAGHTSTRQILALNPDIVKIDAFFLRAASRSARPYATFEHLVGLAQSLVDTVVVEGVETIQQRDAACALGVTWLQGYHLGRPSLTRVWVDWDYRDSLRKLMEFRSLFQPPDGDTQRAA
ncbi:EAL domain-containing protein [Sphingobium sp. BYY-5]|uniref:EAL domain-containing protein n=1 Tax=Sphingobium sp. BYY-5 TaxID=2926400 RepID=UPI001FA80A5F|nr:EAL domain-containing protein [Sphingobium sp. BYY-5]MCI4589268.1 EAL domain-containing protein [Sphingobium sp. BYY-5]